MLFYTRAATRRYLGAVNKVLVLRKKLIEQCKQLRIGKGLFAMGKNDGNPLPPLMPSAALRWDVVSSLLPRSIGDVLEMGCGQGAVAVRLAERANRFVALEPDPKSFAIAKSRVGNMGTVLNISSQNLPKDDLFDLVCAFEVLEHIEDDRAALRDWISRLRPGGTIMLSVPALAHRFAAADYVAGHFRRYDRTVMSRRLEDAGLSEIRIVLYGFPTGYILEAARNFLAKIKLAGTARHQSIAERTATSGRIFQPRNSLMRITLSSLTIPALWLQRLFPDRGVGMIATACKPI